MDDEEKSRGMHTRLSQSRESSSNSVLGADAQL
jgi:hypothetical protein